MVTEGAVSVGKTFIRLKAGLTGTTGRTSVLLFTAWWWRFPFAKMTVRREREEGGCSSEPPKFGLRQEIEGFNRSWREFPSRGTARDFELHEPLPSEKKPSGLPWMWTGHKQPVPAEK